MVTAQLVVSCNTALSKHWIRGNQDLTCRFAAASGSGKVLAQRLYVSDRSEPWSSTGVILATPLNHHLLFYIKKPKRSACNFHLFTQFCIRLKWCKQSDISFFLKWAKNSTLQNFLKIQVALFQTTMNLQSTEKVLVSDLRAELNSLVSHKLSLISGISPGIDL